MPHCLTSQITSGWNANKALAPGATQLTLTSSSTLDRSRYLRSQISSGYIATRLHCHSAISPLGHNARSPATHFDEVIHSAQATLLNDSDQLRLERHQGHSARSQEAHIDEVIHSTQATMPNESDQLRLERHQGHSARS